MSINQIIASIIAPIFLLLALSYMRFKFKTKSYKRVFKALGLGALGFLVFLGIHFLTKYLGLNSIEKTGNIIFYTFIIIGLISELIKFLILKSFFYPYQDFKGPFEGIIYSLFITIGFTIIAVSAYSFGFVINIQNVLLIYTYNLASLLFAVILGFYLGLEKLKITGGINSVTAIFTTSVFHGIYMFCFLTENYLWLGFFGIALIVTATALGIKAHSFHTYQASNIS